MYRIASEVTLLTEKVNDDERTRLFFSFFGRRYTLNESESNTFSFFFQYAHANHVSWNENITRPSDTQNGGQIVFCDGFQITMSYLIETWLSHGPLGPQTTSTSDVLHLDRIVLCPRKA